MVDSVRHHLLRRHVVSFLDTFSSMMLKGTYPILIHIRSVHLRSEQIIQLEVTIEKQFTLPIHVHKDSIEISTDVTLTYVTHI